MRLPAPRKTLRSIAFIDSGRHTRRFYTKMWQALGHIREVAGTIVERTAEAGRRSGWLRGPRAGGRRAGSCVAIPRAGEKPVHDGGDVRRAFGDAALDRGVPP